MPTPLRDATNASAPARRSPWRFLPPIAVLLGLALVFGTGAHRYLSFGALVEHRAQAQALVEGNAASALMLYVAIYVTAVTLSVPGAVFLTILGGFLFGWALGGAVAALSATIGATGLFLVARTSIGDALLARVGERGQRLAEGFRRDAFSYLLFIRFLPVVPFWLTNLASALFGVRLKTFFLATLIGILPGTFAFAVAGAGLDSIIEAQRRARDACLAAGGADCALDLSVKSLVTPEILAAFVGLGLMALAPILVRRFFAGLDGRRGGA